MRLHATGAGVLVERTPGAFESISGSLLDALTAGAPEGTPAELDPAEIVRPLDPPEVWCSGVTYERSRNARMEESSVADVYALVYDAERPELFLKDAACRRTVGPGEPVAIRSDSKWNVPEPEIGL